MEFLTKNNTGQGYEKQNLLILQNVSLALEIYDDYIVCGAPWQLQYIQFPSNLVLKTIFHIIKSEPHKIKTSAPMNKFAKYLKNQGKFQGFYRECTEEQRIDLMAGILGSTE